MTLANEWNCTCVRCERERDWLDNVDDEPEPTETAPPLEVPVAD